MMTQFLNGPLYKVIKLTGNVGGEGVPHFWGAGGGATNFEKHWGTICFVYEWWDKKF